MRRRVHRRGTSAQRPPGRRTCDRSAGQPTVRKLASEIETRALARRDLDELINAFMKAARADLGVPLAGSMGHTSPERRRWKLPWTNTNAGVG
jgi:hypothetical protein